MFETVSVDEALKRGKKIVFLPTLFIILGLLLLTVYLYVKICNSSFFLFIGLFSSIVFSWLYWSIMITRWRIWAFENVRNIQELKKRALKEQLIGKDGGFFEKTEIRTAADKAKLNALQYKLLQPDVFIEDYTVPSETQIYYSKNKTLGEIVLGFVMILGSGYFFIELDKPLLGIALIVVGICIMYSGFKKYRNKLPQIILNSRGIQTAEIPFYEWSEYIMKM